ncbi:hypothetical protein ACHAPU_011388 [Fusarium lateritium]
MLISDSPLFKEFARPIIKSEPSRARAVYPPFRIMDTVVQYLLDLAKLETTQFKISNVSQDSFDLTIESRLVGTGIISSTINATDVNLSFNGYSFGELRLPQIQTSFWGTKLVTREQRVVITNHTACRAFVRSLIVDDNTSLQLESKRCTVGALGTSSTCNLHLDVPLKAMGGPHMALKKLLRAGESATTIFNLDYTGPVEIDCGHCIFEFRNGNSETLAEMKGDLNMAQSQINLALHGTTRSMATTPSNKIRLVGICVEGEKKSWLSDTIREVDTVFDLEPKYVEQLWC